VHDHDLADRGPQGAAQAAPQRTSGAPGLVDEHGAEVAESTVRTYVAKVKAELSDELGLL
jgi:hypothetical protein